MSAQGTAVIIPLYNGGPWIEQTLQSVQNQNRPPAEVVLVDDGSSDDSVARASRFPHVRILRNPEKGANAAREFGLAQTTAPFVAMLDQDDLWHPTHLDVLERLADSKPAANAVFAGMIKFEADAGLNFSPEALPPREFDPWESFPAATIPTPSQVLMRREALTKMGGWTRRFIGLADYHAWLRLSAPGAFWHLPQATVGYRQHPGSHSAVLRRDQRNAFVTRLFAAAEDVLPKRIHFFPHEEAMLARRLQIGRAMLAWLTALEAGPLTEAMKAAETLEKSLANESRSTVAALWGQLFYLCTDSTAQQTTVSKARKVMKTYWRAPYRTPRVRGSLRNLLFKRAREALGRYLPDRG